MAPPTEPAPSSSDEGDPICTCAAVLVVRQHPPASSTGVALLLAATAFGAFTTVYSMGLTPRTAVRTPCCYLGVLPLVLWGAVLGRRQLTHRGRLLLRDETLEFRWLLRGPPVRIPLRDLRRVGRNHRRIHLTQASGTDHFFDCSRLAGEDLFDQLLARLDALGVEAVRHERDR